MALSCYTFSLFFFSPVLFLCSIISVGQQTVVQIVVYFLPFKMLQDSVFLITMSFVKACSVRSCNVDQQTRMVLWREGAGGVTAYFLRILKYVHPCSFCSVWVLLSWFVMDILCEVSLCGLNHLKPIISSAIHCRVVVRDVPLCLSISSFHGVLPSWTLDDNRHTGTPTVSEVFSLRCQSCQIFFS